MKSQVLNMKGLNALRLVLLVNLNASIIFLLIITIITLSGSEVFLPDERDLYGPLAGDGDYSLQLLPLQPQRTRVDFDGWLFNSVNCLVAGLQHD